MGYWRAGYDVLGVDHEPQPNYPFPFVQADALDYLFRYGDRFDAIHASPPCQPYSSAVTSRSSPYVPTRGRDEPSLIGPVWDLLRPLPQPWVIENVMGARPFMPPGWVMLCGAMFSRPIPRHRVFSSNVHLEAPEHPASCRGLANRSAAQLGWEWRDMSVTGKGRRAGTSDRWAYLLGIDWPMTQSELAEAIPPAYTEWIGGRLLADSELYAAELWA